MIDIIKMPMETVNPAKIPSVGFAPLMELYAPFVLTLPKKIPMEFVNALQDTSLTTENV